MPRKNTNLPSIFIRRDGVKNKVKVLTYKVRLLMYTIHQVANVMGAKVVENLTKANLVEDPYGK